MRRWMAKAFIWAWWLVGLSWLPARGRLPALVALLYAAVALLLASVLPPRPRALVPLERQLAMRWFTDDGRTFVTSHDHYPVAQQQEEAIVVQRWDVGTGQL